MSTHDLPPSPAPPVPAWFIGLVGFSYPEWIGTFYPSTPSRPDSSRMLAFYARHFNTVEVNTTFYALPTADTIGAWSRAVPPGFRFCIKMNREVTHGPTPPGALAASGGPPPGHLLRPDTIDLARRLIDAVAPLGPRLGPVLLQFPPRFAPEPGRGGGGGDGEGGRMDELIAFLQRLRSPVALAVELRHPGWTSPGPASTVLNRALTDLRIALVTSDESPQHFAARDPSQAGRNAPAPRPIHPAADFLYFRWLGRHGQFKERTRERIDPRPRLRWWLARAQEVLKAHPHLTTAYGFFDNDFAGHAPTTARRFQALLAGTADDASAAAGPFFQNEPDQPSLFGP